MREQAKVEGGWDLSCIPVDAIDRGLVEGREDLFYLVSAASFVEIAAHLYTANLVEYCAGDDEVVGWLEHGWQVEETRHGEALRAYVRAVWPAFDWDRAYEAFFADYSQQCTIDQFEPTPGLEMIARCVVETGTSTFYEALAALAGEPVLAGIAARIRSDEIGHYKHFYAYFRKYDAAAPHGRVRIAAALKRRLLEARREDAECAVRHVFACRNPDAVPDQVEFRALCQRLTRQVTEHYPVAMAAKMLLKPLRLPRFLARFLEGPVAVWAVRILGSGVQRKEARA